MRALVPVGESMYELGGIGRTTLWALVRDGHLRKANIGRRAFITGESLADYITNLTEGSR